LCIPKDAWTGEKLMPDNLNKTERQYMEQLKQQLEVARAYAQEHAEQAQADYVHVYNKRAKNKSFAIGDKVIILYADCNNKLLSEWQTGTIRDVFSDTTILLNCRQEPGRIFTLIFLRPFAVRVNSVIVDADEDFGEILSVPVSEGTLRPSHEISKTAIAHYRMYSSISCWICWTTSLLFAFLVNVGY
jgi:hypothetical protein